MSSSTKKPEVRGRILVVDDDPDYVLGTRLYLEKRGYEVVTAAGMEEGWSHVEEGSVDAAVVDLMMQAADDGFTLCHRIKQLHPRMPVILVTGVLAETGIDFHPRTAREQSWMGADALLEKPVRYEQLDRELSRVLEV